MPEEQAGGGWVLGRHYRVVHKKWEGPYGGQEWCRQARGALQ